MSLQTVKKGAMGSQSASAKPAHARGSRHSVITDPFARPGSSAFSSRAVQACKDLLEPNQHKCTERYGHVKALIALFGDTDTDSQCSNANSWCSDATSARFDSTYASRASPRGVKNPATHWCTTEDAFECAPADQAASSGGTPRGQVLAGGDAQMVRDESCLLSAVLARKEEASNSNGDPSALICALEPVHFSCQTLRHALLAAGIVESCPVRER